MYYNILSTSYSRKNSIHKFFGTALKKNHEHTEDINLQFHNFKFSQNGILDFHGTTATADVCMKEVIDSSLCRAFWRKIIDTLKALILTTIGTKFSQQRSLSYLEDYLWHKQFIVPFTDGHSLPEVLLNISQN